ncbi:SRPBCC family protein [Shewanella surugensis]|uniref:SRPBCC family protein n=1 Tax=Shewanella surugensis TaxID=212020 RepID=A0ABT0LJG1_9GAMM|nr:SRPBCC family protein [Shewanella surugensis]MCL1127437.1 SRPBCC family protein [Shewanella surugensis]
MPQFIAKKIINAPINTVWPLLDDFENIQIFHPGVDQSNSLNDQAKGLGAKRQCNFYDGGFAQEEIVKYDPDHGFMTVNIYAGTPMKAIKKFNVDFSAEKTTDNQTKVTVRAGSHFVNKD